DSDFYLTLRRTGDLTDDTSLAAVPLRVGEGLQPLSSKPPNIFIFVVDSLRPDYVSPYNPAVTFTPAIGRFAAESFVAKHAFTSYAGTALSEPAIWAGGMIPRGIYVKPFAAVNNLERLARLGGYRRYVSVDEVLAVVLEDWQDVVHVDAD